MTLNPATNNLVAAKLPVFTRAGLFRYVGNFLRHLVAAHVAAVFALAGAGQNRRGGMHAQNALPFRLGHRRVRADADVFRRAVDEGHFLPVFLRIYGVYFFSDCAWIGLATVYVIAAILLRQGTIAPVLKRNYFYFLGVLLLGFTLFSAYTEFAQYFVVWNANMPEETFWYLIRERGNWWTLEPGFDLRPFLHPVFRAAAGEGEDEFQNHHSRLPVDLADARAGPGV